jgi:hypothetical protein
MRYIVGFGAFWYDFIIGDDWSIAVAVAITLAVLLFITHQISHSAVVWWLLPLVVIASLGASLWRAAQET